MQTAEAVAAALAVAADDVASTAVVVIVLDVDANGRERRSAVEEARARRVADVSLACVARKTVGVVVARPRDTRAWGALLVDARSAATRVVVAAADCGVDGGHNGAEKDDEGENLGGLHGCGCGCGCGREEGEKSVCVSAEAGLFIALLVKGLNVRSSTDRGFFLSLPRSGASALSGCQGDKGRSHQEERLGDDENTMKT